MSGGTRALENMVAALRAPRTRLAWQRYLGETRRPTHSLLFLLALALLYEVGRIIVARRGGFGSELLVPGAMHGLLRWFGIVGRWVPAVLLVVSLLVWHRLRRDHWGVRPWVLGTMVAESLVLTVPLLVLSALLGPSGGAAISAWPVKLVAAFGAGAYEELVFRLLLISGLLWVWDEFVGQHKSVGRAVATLLAAAFCAACHFVPIGHQRFAWGPFWFQFIAALYLSVIYWGRGLGVAGGCHAAYDLLWICLRGTSSAS